MSLSKLIIYRSTAEVAQYIEQTEVALDEVDEFGFTPLVQTAIVDDYEKAEVLLKAGAKVDFPDLIDRTALYWAASNNNIDLCRLLLKYKADPNAFSRAGQSVLVMPFLRDQTRMKELLYQYGADLDFARDFVNAKLLGHRFDLQARVDVVTDKNVFIEMEFEGFYLEFSLALVTQSLTEFKNNFGGRSMRRYFAKLNVIIQALDVASKLIKYQHYLIDADKYADQIDAYLKQHPLIIPIAFGGHAITLIKYYDWLIRCDRGEFGRDHGTVIIYKIGQPQWFTRSFIKKLMYKKQDKEFINEGMIQMLALQEIDQLPLSTQISGNCSWANVEAVIPALMYVLSLEASESSNVVDLGGAKNDALMFYEEWVKWDKNRALHYCINEFNAATPARKASKAAALAAVLFQCFDYSNPDDQQKAEEMIHILTHPDYLYILQSYVHVFHEQRDNPHMQSLRGFLDQFGVDINDLLVHRYD